MSKISRLFHKYNTKEYRVLLIILTIFFTIFTTVSLHRYWQYAAWYYDFGIFYTAISSVAQLKEPIIDHFIFQDQNILGDHFHPIIFLISPFVALVQKGEVLLIFQTLFVTLSGIFVYKISKHYQKNNFESFTMLTIYFSFIGLHNALITEFHAITLLPLPLSIFFYGMIKKKKLLYFLGFFAVLLTKESTFIIPAWFSLLIIFKNKKEWRKIGLFSLIFSVAYGYILLNYVFKYFNGTGYYYLNDAPKSLAEFIPKLTTMKLKTIFYSLASFGFLPLFAPETLPPILFNWWSRFYSLATTRHDLGLHYNAEVTPTLILAANIGWVRIKKLISKIIPSLKNHYFKILLFLIAVFVSSLSYLLRSPILLFGNLDFYKHTKNSAFLDKLIENIPEDGIIMAQANIAAKIAYRKVYILRDDYKLYPNDYIVIDERDGQEPNNFLGISFRALADRLANDRKYEIFYDQGEQKIYKRIEK